jgi:hypothetical protein
MSSLLAFNIVYRLEIQSVMLEFRSSLTFSMIHLPHPSPPSQSISTVYTDSLWLGGDRGWILQEFNQIHNVQNIYTTLFAKNQGGEGASDR